MRKGFSPIIILLVVAGFLVVGATGYFYSRSHPQAQVSIAPVPPPPATNTIPSGETPTPPSPAERVYSPSNTYYAVQKYVKSEQVTCCGNDEPYERKLYSVSLYKSAGNKLIKEFTEFNIGNYQGYTPSINKWHSDNVLQINGEGIIDAFSVFYDISKDKLIPEWEFEGGN